MLGLLVPGLSMGGGNTVADVDGFGRMEYTLPSLRAEFTAPELRMEFTAPNQRFEYTSQDNE